MTEPATPTETPERPMDGAVIEDLMRQQGEAMQALFAPFLPTSSTPAPDPADMQHWAMSAAKLQKMWLDFGAEQVGQVEPVAARIVDPARWTSLFSTWYAALPLAHAETQAKLWEDGLELWTTVLGRYGIGPAASGATPDAKDAPLPRQDRRFADPRWRRSAVVRAAAPDLPDAGRTAHRNG